MTHPASDMHDDSESTAPLKPEALKPATERIIEKIAEAVTTTRREGTSDQHDMADQIARECIPLFEQLGMTNEGDGWGFEDD